MSVGESMTIGAGAPAFAHIQFVRSGNRHANKKSQPTCSYGSIWVMLELRGYPVGMGLKSKSYLGLTAVPSWWALFVGAK